MSAIRQNIPLTEVFTAGDQVSGQFWYTAPTPGVDDPQPIDSTFAVVFYTGSQSGANSFQLDLRAVAGIDTSQTMLEGLTQAQLDGPQPGLVSISDSEEQSYLELIIAWGSSNSVTIQCTPTYTGGVYQWSDPYTLTNNTYYLARMSIADTVARIQVYNLNQSTFAVGSLIFDTGTIDDSYNFIRRSGRVGWLSTLMGGPSGPSEASRVAAPLTGSWIRSIRPESVVFAEYQSAQFNSMTPVAGARLYAYGTPDVTLWQSWSPVGSPNQPILTPDARRTISGQSTRVDITQPTTSGQGVISNVLTPVDDSLSGITDWPHITINFDLWVLSAMLVAGGSLAAYLISEDGNNIPLNLPRLLPGQWQSITLNAPPGLQSGLYQLGLTYVGTTATSFWIDSVSINQRIIAWSARPSDNTPWIDFNDTLNSDSAGISFELRGSQLQMRAQALRQDAAVTGVPHLVPIYAQLGRAVWPDEIQPSPITISTGTFPIGNLTWAELTNTWSTYTSTWYNLVVLSHGAPITFTGGGVWSNPLGSIINWYWSFGDGGVANGQVVSYTYISSGTYFVSLIVEDTWGVRTPFFLTLVVT